MPASSARLQSQSLAQARRAMVDNQIRTFDVTDRAVLAAFDAVPREAFLPEAHQALAYLDRRIDLPVTGGTRSLLPPLILARLIQALHPISGERALDVLGGQGYSAAILAAIGLETSAIEADAALSEAAKAAFSATQSPAIALPAQPDLSARAGAALPGQVFDVILINGASALEPTGFFPLLAEGGRLGMLMRKGQGAQALVYVKANGITSPRFAFDAQAPLLPGFADAPGFVF